MTRNQVGAGTGARREHFVLETFEECPDPGDLIEAAASARAGERGLIAERRPMSAKVARLCAMLEVAAAAASDPLELDERR